MSGNLSKKPSLLIVSDTTMYRENGSDYAFGPVVREIEAIAPLFDHITWIGFDQPQQKDNKAILKIQHPSIKLVRLKACGGNRLIDKLSVLFYTPIMLIKIAQVFFQHDVIHTRAPSSPAFLAVLLSFFFKKKKIYWNKYAGNWNQTNPPLFYGLQRSLLKKASFSHVTINGKWEGQPSHCLSFENPCLTGEDLRMGTRVMEQKRYDGKLNFCFVGRLEDAKGVGRILDAFAQIQSDRIGTIHLVGDGPGRAQYEQQAKQLPYPVIFHGFLDRNAVNKIYEISHLFLLPSDSEGFPKVLAEAMNFGCVPIVSAVSSIPQYIQDGVNGFLWEVNQTDFTTRLSHLIKQFDPVYMADIAVKANQIAHKYTYTFYTKRIQQEILTSD